jgi:hypothetical protein
MMMNYKRGKIYEDWLHGHMTVIGYEDMNEITFPSYVRCVLLRLVGSYPCLHPLWYIHVLECQEAQMSL